MKRANRVFLAVGFVSLIIISWVIVLGAKSNDDKQTELIAQATAYLNDEVYILAVPLLEEAAVYNAVHTLEAEAMLKEVYLHLMDQRGYRRKYIDLLEKQMSRKDAAPEVFHEAASFYLDGSKYTEAFTVLKDGIAKTGNNDLVNLYESNRYAYRLGYDFYDDVTMIHGTTIGVSRDGLWGIANADGSLQIPCMYEKISTFSVDRAIVQRDGKIFAIDRNNNRCALLKENASDFGNFASDRLPIQIDGKWYRSTGDFERGSAAFDWVGTHVDGNAAALSNGKWGVINRSADWVVPAEYDEIIMDELGRAYGQGAVFARKGGALYLIVNGVQTGEAYEDARPFGSEGYAAVKQNGLWGFINTSGEVMIPYSDEYEDALSFGQHLAAVKQGEYWGYISLYGDLAIEPIFLQAKSFADGNAPVLTERGWRFLTLTEYRKGAGL